MPSERRLSLWTTVSSRTSPSAGQRRHRIRWASQLHSKSMFEAVDHLGIATDDLEAAVRTYVEGFGLREIHREVVSEQGARTVVIECGDTHLELLAPLGPDTPVGRFLARKGPGLHHVAYRVDDLDAALEAVTASGIERIDREPRRGIMNSRVAFLHPRSTGGVLTELVEPASEHVR